MIQSLGDDSNHSRLGIYAVIGLPAFYGMVCYIYHVYESFILLKTIEKIESETLLLRVLNLTIQTIENFEDPSWHDRTWAVVTMHRNHCKRVDRRDCPCSKIDRTGPTRDLGYRMIEGVLEELKRSNPKSKTLVFYLLYVSLYKRDNLFKAAFLYQHLQGQKRSISESICLARIGLVLEERVRLTNIDKQDAGKSVKKMSEVGMVLRFEREFFKFRETMIQTATKKEAFLVELEIGKNDLKTKMDTLTAFIFKRQSSIAQQYALLNALKTGSLPLMILYAYFNLLIFNLKAEANKIINKIQAIKDEQERSNRIKYDTIAKIRGIISVSVQPASIGRIVLADRFMLGLLDYSKSELETQTLNNILPTNVAKIHDKLLLKFAERGVSQIINKKLLRFMIGKNGCLIPVILEAKLHFTAEGGIDMVGTVHSIRSTEKYQHKSSLRYYLSYNQATGDIGYVCKNCDFYLGFL